MKPQQLISQGSLERMLQVAEHHWNRREFQESLETLERASRLAPTNSEILLQLGRLHGLRYDYAAAEQQFEKAVRFSADKSRILAAAGQKALDFTDHRIAESYFQRALSQRNSAEICVKLAELYERLHRVADAAELIERALNIEPGFAPALLVHARLYRGLGQLEQAEKLLRSFLQTADRILQIRGWYELGTVLDRQRRYDEAMAAFLEAKKLLHPEGRRFARELETFRQRIQKMQADLSLETVKQWLENGSNLHSHRRLALLCGHPRSGTTLLEQVLDSHPNIVSAEETEIFLNEAYIPLMRNLPNDAGMLRVLKSAQNDALNQCRGSYFKTMELCVASSTSDKLMVDKNPSFNFLIPAYLRIFPETQFLIALRDPRDVCLSCFMQAYPVLQRATAAYLSIESTIEDYAFVMGIWKSIAPLIPDRYLEIRYEDMVNGLEPVARQLLHFLGFSWDARVLEFHEQARKKIVRSPSYNEVAKPVFNTAVGRWKNYSKYFEPHLDKLAPFLKAFGYD